VDFRVTLIPGLETVGGVPISLLGLFIARSPAANDDADWLDHKSCLRHLNLSSTIDNQTPLKSRPIWLRRREHGRYFWPTGSCRSQSRGVL